MRRAIYEDDVIKLLDKGWKLGVYPVASNIHALPSAQPEQKTGKWIFIGDGYKCSECGSVYNWWADSQTSNYCPNCGTEMSDETE